MTKQNTNFQKRFWWILFGLCAAVKLAGGFVLGPQKAAVLFRMADAAIVLLLISCLALRFFNVKSGKEKNIALFFIVLCIPLLALTLASVFWGTRYF